MTAIKICGVTRVEDAVLACELGAAYIGFNFSAGSPRRLEIDRAGELSDAVRPGVLRVGVFVDEPADEMARASEVARLDLLQVHRPVSAAQAGTLSRPLLAVVHVGPGGPWRLPEGVAALCRGVLFDTAAATPGGTGRTFAWDALAGRRFDVPLFLAGGLTAENVARAIAQVRPDAVDVASGVEASPGKKDPVRMRRFFEAVREADADAARHAV